MGWWENRQERKRVQAALLALANEVFTRLLQIGGTLNDLRNVKNAGVRDRIVTALFFMGGKAVQVLDPVTFEEENERSFSPYRLFRLLRPGTFPLPIIRFLILDKGLIPCDPRDMAIFAKTVPAPRGEARLLAPTGAVRCEQDAANGFLFTTLRSKSNGSEWIPDTYIAPRDEEQKPRLDSSYWYSLVRVPR